MVRGGREEEGNWMMRFREGSTSEQTTRSADLEATTERQRSLVERNY